MDVKYASKRMMGTAIARLLDDFKCRGPRQAKRWVGRGKSFICRDGQGCDLPVTVFRISAQCTRHHRACRSSSRAGAPTARQNRDDLLILIEYSRSYRP